MLLTLTVVDGWRGEHCSTAALGNSFSRYFGCLETRPQRQAFITMTAVDPCIVMDCVGNQLTGNLNKVSFSFEMASLGILDNQ